MNERSTAMFMLIGEYFLTENAATNICRATYNAQC